jgi:hypothetical protein
MLSSTTLTRWQLSTLAQCVSDRADAFGHSRTIAEAGGRDEEALGHDLAQARFASLARKAAAAIDSGRLLTLDDLEHAIEALRPLEQRLSRTLNRDWYWGVRKLREQLQRSAESMSLDEY